jgi:hypothetical protein
MRAEPGSVLAIPPDWNLPLDVNFHRRITSVSTDDPLATLTPGVHIAAAVMGMRLRATANIAVPMPGAVARDGRSVPMVPGTSVSHIEGRATVSLRADVADNGSIRDIRFDAVTFEFEKQRSDLQAMYATQRGVVFRDNPTRARN